MKKPRYTFHKDDVEGTRALWIRDSEFTSVLSFVYFRLPVFIFVYFCLPFSGNKGYRSEIVIRFAWGAVTSNLELDY